MTSSSAATAMTAFEDRTATIISTEKTVTTRSPVAPARTTSGAETADDPQLKGGPDKDTTITATR